MKLKDGQKANSAIMWRMMECDRSLKLKDEDYPGLPDICIEDSKLTRCVLKPGVTSYRIPEGVTYITMHSLWGYSSPITKGTEYKSSLETLYISKSVSHIESSALNGLLFLEEIIVDEENPYFKSQDGILYTKDGKKLVACPPGRADELLVIPSGVEVIGENSFENSLVIRIEVPDTVRIIEEDAFWFSYSRELDLTRTEIDVIGERVFYDVDNMTIYAGGNELPDRLFNDESVYNIVYDDSKLK